ncbi:MAG: AEC family transporter [Gammaproteobacteria bacterium]|nr:AEC family transporter [Gammaproteobacteria bacterium]
MNTLQIIAPLASIAFLGFVCVKYKLFNKSQMDSLSAVCFNLLIPLFLFKTTYKTDLSAQLSISWFASFYIPVVCYFLTIFLINKGKKKAIATATLESLTASYSNTVLIAIPIIAFYLSEQSAGRAFVLIAFHSAILFSLTELLVNNTGYKTITRTLKNPIVLSILGGLTCNVLGVPISNYLLEPMATLSMSAIPLALFGLGAAMYFLPIKGNRILATGYAFSKLLILPSLVFVLARYGFKLDHEQVFIAVLLSASPTGVGAYIMATKYQKAENIAATTVVFSTLLAPLTYWLWLEILI